MHPRNTKILVALAAGLFAFIYFFERHWGAPVVVDTRVLPGFRPAAVRSVQIKPASQPAIRAERTNGGWQLTAPQPYPAQGVAIDALLQKLETLTYDAQITAKDLRNKPKVNEEFGFEQALYTITLEQGPEPQLLKIGRLTPPGNQVYLQVVGRPEIDVLGLELLGLLPGPTNDWRDTTFVNLKGVDLDRVTITNGAKVVELQRVNQVWRMVLPLKARADHPKINGLLAELQKLQVTAFQPEGNPAGLEAYGLQPPVWELAIFKGTNQLFALQFGKSPTNDDTQIFARLSGRNAVVQVPRAELNAWRAEYNQFRDPLLAGWITAPLDAIEVHGPVENFTLQRTNNNYWRIIAPSRNWPADGALTVEYIKTLATLEVTNYLGLFPNDTATDSQLAEAGLREPARKYVLTRSAAGPAGNPTNQVVAELDFGARKDDILFARRGDLTETNTIYAVRAADIDKLPTTMLAMREHRLFPNLNLDNVNEVDVRANGLLSQYQRRTENEWMLKQGTWDTNMRLSVGAAAGEIAELSAQTWVGWGDQALADHGFTDKSVAIDLVFTEKGRLVLRLGGLSPNGLRYGATRLEDGETWVFEIPPLTMDRLTAYLKLPPFP